jgi:peroxiredoxin
MPAMQRLYDRLAGEDFEILAVSVDAPFGQTDAMGNRGGDLAAFADELGLSFPVLHNPTGNIQRLYQTTGVPESFVIGLDGIIYKKVAGPTEWDSTENEELIRRLLAAK